MCMGGEAMDDQLGSVQWPTIQALSEKLAMGSISSVELITHYMKQIAANDKQGQQINAILEVNPDVFFIAEALDAKRATQGALSSLHGIPVLLKDNIDTRDNMHTSAGSLALKDNYARRDAFLVSKLRAAGAIVLGKANLTEWANFMAEDMPNGFSSRGGQVLNYYGAGVFDVGGSSSGSAAGVAAGFAPAAVGTETSGSILSPASANHMVGIKPTVGLISRSGIIPIAHSQDTAGPIAQTVWDAALLLCIMAGPDAHDPATLRNRVPGHLDYTRYLTARSLSGIRLGVPGGAYLEAVRSDKLTVFHQALNVLRRLGAEVVEPIVLYAFDDMDMTVLKHEFKVGVNAYLHRHHAPNQVKNLTDVIAFNNQHEKSALTYGQSVLIEANETDGTLTSPGYIQARLEDIRLSRAQGIDKVMEAHQLNALLFIGAAGSEIAAKAGYPSISVPVGFTPSGEPVGLTFTGKAFSESLLLSYAYALEQAIVTM
jgi:amidase